MERVQKEQIRQTPGLLLINVDFDEFQPNTHRWVLFSLGTRNQGSYEAMVQAKHWFGRLAQLVTESDSDLFTQAAILQRDISPSDTIKIFEVKPGIFGLSIDLLAGAAFVKKYFLSKINSNTK